MKPATTNPTIPFTAEAYLKLEQELARLTQTRAEVMKRVQIAREMGDLSENAAYKYGRMELGSLSRQISKIKHLLAHGQVVAKKSKYEVVDFGCTVTLDDGKKSRDYLIVSVHESNPMEGKLSTASPIGAAIMGKKVGDSVQVKIPVGEVTYTITGLS
ncbi:MAG TPA: transcription elongation factor GreA [Vitreimonas sp.]|nr:transcription elongation factor GreA [Vitreimonas sp.]